MTECASVGCPNSWQGMEILVEVTMLRYLQASLSNPVLSNGQTECISMKQEYLFVDDIVKVSCTDRFRCQSEF